MQVRQISSEKHLAYIAGRPSVSFLQTPAWGATKSGWTSLSLGWFVGEDLVGGGGIKRRDALQHVAVAKVDVPVVGAAQGEGLSHRRYGHRRPG